MKKSAIHCSQREPMSLIPKGRASCSKLERELFLEKKQRSLQYEIKGNLDEIHSLFGLSSYLVNSDDHNDILPFSQSTSASDSYDEQRLRGGVNGVLTGEPLIPNHLIPDPLLEQQMHRIFLLLKRIVKEQKYIDAAEALWMENEDQEFFNSRCKTKLLSQREVDEETYRGTAEDLFG